MGLPEGPEPRPEVPLKDGLLEGLATAANLRHKLLATLLFLGGRRFLHDLLWAGKRPSIS